MCSNKDTKLTLNKYYVKPGDEIEFMSIEDQKHKFKPMIIKGIVTKVLANSVIVDMRMDKNYRNYYEHETTVVNHNRYKITQTAISSK